MTFPITSRALEPHPAEPKRRKRRARLFWIAFIACLALVGSAAPALGVTRGEVEAARERRQRLQEQLDATVEAYNEAQNQLARTQESMERNRNDLAALEEIARDAQDRVSVRANEVYRQGPATMFQFLIGAESFNDFSRRLKLLEEASEQDADILQEAEIARLQVSRLQADLNAQQAQERIILEQMAKQTDSLGQNFEEARDLEVELAGNRASAVREAEQRAAEEAAQEAAEQARQSEAAAEEPSPSASSPSPSPQPTPSPTPAASPSPSPSASPSPEQGPSGPSASGLFCPVDGPVSFTDTYGDPRSGGRSHEGVDMFAARGTPLAAITDGAITRRSSSTLGGLYIYFTGTDGTEYFYTHLSGYADVPVGRQIEGGTHIGYVGNSGNARGTPPHVHFEMAPPGQGTINPTPTARRACGK